MTFTFRVPGSPPTELSPNASLKTPAGMKNRLREDMRRDWGNAIKQVRNAIRPYPQTPVFSGKVVAEIVYGKPRNGRDRDPDNLIATIKYGLDQLEKQGIVSNDRYLDPVVKEQVKDPEGVGYLEITVRAAQSRQGN